MAKFKYNGDHVNMSLMGITFRVEGENVFEDVTDEYRLGKLRGNSHFDEIKEPKKAGRPKSTK